MRANMTLKLAAVTAFGVLVNGALAAPLANPNFEAGGGSLAGWTTTNGAVTLTSGSAALSGSSARLVRAGLTSGGELYQDIDAGENLQTYTLSLDFAAGAVSNNADSARAFQLGLRTASTGASNHDGPQLNIIVLNKDGGTLGDVYVRNSAVWTKVLDDIVDFSPSTSNLVNNTMSVSVDYTAGGGAIYDLTVNGLTAADLQYWQSSPPNNGKLTQVSFDARFWDTSETGAFMVVDNVVVPEPTMAALAGLVLPLTGARRFRKAR